MGNHGEVLKLADGSLWEVQNEYQYLYAYYPSVTVCPNRGILLINGKSLRVRALNSQQPKAPMAKPSAPSQNWTLFEETSLAGSISGTVQQGRIFKTTSGNIYEVTGLTLQLVLELQPDVTVLKNGDSYKLVVDGFDEPLICRKLTPDSKAPAVAANAPAATAGREGADGVIESRIDGDFEGWDGDTIFKLQNGQIWQQSSSQYTYHYAYSPKVFIYKSGASFRMQVEGVTGAIQVTRLK